MDKQQLLSKQQSSRQEPTLQSTNKAQPSNEQTASRAYHTRKQRGTLPMANTPLEERLQLLGPSQQQVTETLAMPAPLDMSQGSVDSFAPGFENRERSTAEATSLIGKYAAAFSTAKDALDFQAMEILSPMIARLSCVVFNEPAKQALKKTSESNALSVVVPKKSKEDKGNEGKVTKPSSEQKRDTNIQNPDDKQELAAQIIRDIGPHMFRNYLLRQPEVNLASIHNRLAADILASISIVQTARVTTADLDKESAESSSLDLTQRYWAKDSLFTKVAERLTAASACAANYTFLKTILHSLGDWHRIAVLKDIAPGFLSKLDGKVAGQEQIFGSQADVGAWDEAIAKDKLTALINVSERDAMDVLSMIESASPDVRPQIVSRLDVLGLLDTFCRNLPYRRVQALSETLADPVVTARLHPYYNGKVAGESCHQMLQDKSASLQSEGHNVLAAMTNGLDHLHNFVTLGFAHGYGGAYDAYQDGEISVDGFASQVTLEAAKTIASVAAGGAAGMVAGTAARSAAAGAQVRPLLANAAGVAAGGLVENGTAVVIEDGIDVMSGQSAGFSLPDMAQRTLQGTVINLGVGGVKAGVSGTVNQVNARRQSIRDEIAEGKLDASHTPKENMKDPFAPVDEYLANRMNELPQPMIRQLNSINSNAASKGHLVRAKELYQQSRRRLGKNYKDTKKAKANVALARKNTALVTKGSPAAKMMNGTDVERFIGKIDKDAGKVYLKHKESTMSGFITTAEEMTTVSTTADKAIAGLGLDKGKNDYYQANYKSQKDDLWVLEFETIDVDKAMIPVAADHASLETPIGEASSDYNHRPGVGVTTGNLREGTLARNTAVRISKVYRVGEPEKVYEIIPGTKIAPKMELKNPHAVTNQAVMSVSSRVNAQEEETKQ